MCMRNSSFARIDKEVARKLAMDTLQWVKDKRAEDLELEINRVMKWDVRTFFSKLLNKPQIRLTRDQALKKVKENDDFASEYQWIQIRYSSYEGVANRIIALVNQSREQWIYISGEDLMALS